MSKPNLIEREAMANLEYQSAKPVLGRKIGGGLFYCISAFIMFLAAAVSPAHALTYKNSECALSSSQLIPAKAAIVVDAKMSVIY
ncbi:MAG: hypothetical protein AAB275_01670, partial [Deltaproteobacteria bacterium]